LKTIKREQILRGLPVSPGFAVGNIFIYQRFLPTYKERNLTDAEIPVEKTRFERAIKETEQELVQLKDEIRREMGSDLAELISLQIALLFDQDLFNGTMNFIETEKRNAEFAYSEVLKKYIVPLNEAKTPYFRERLADIMDVSTRVLSNILGVELPSIYEIAPGSIIVAYDLVPSEAAMLDHNRVAGIAIEGGGKTSHTAIMTKAKEIPTVVGIENLLKKISYLTENTKASNQPVVLDGSRGILIIEPTDKRIQFYKKEEERIKKQRNYLYTLKESESTTKDGKHIDISANIEFVAEAVSALDNGAQGVGLFRTEYLYLARRRPVTEDEQAEIYSDVAEKMRPYPVIIRTFDFGGDKIIPGYTEPNPYLGWRAVRLCFDNQELFINQIKAILRASTKGNVKMMLPMISDIDELYQAKAFVELAKKDLRQKNVAFDENVELGIMVETPSCAILAEKFAAECNFFSIGSNDLTQYTLAVDRDNKRVAKLYNSLNPGVLNLIKKSIEAAHKQGIWIGICGEFASDPYGIIVLLGMGIDELSMVSGAIPLAKKIVRSIDFSFAQSLSDEVLAMSSSKQVESHIKTKLTSSYPELTAFLTKLESTNHTQINDNKVKKEKIAERK
jgi:phosphotransferase system enzyme I (PtsI)